MAEMKFSIVIPYKQRLDNISLVFESLAEQTMDPSAFEVVVGAMEYAPEYVSLCAQFTDRVNIVSVLSADEWNNSRARNLGMRNASGQVTVLLDADMAVPADFLQTTYERYFQHDQNICVVGQMMGYDEVVENHIETVEMRSYNYYRKTLDSLRDADRTAMDFRWSQEYASAVNRFPWAFARTALVALPTATVREHDLYLDEGFRGWGPEDQEWALRVAASHTPIVLASDVYGLHLPHLRSLPDNSEAARINNRYYLGKWPRLDLELALTFGWLGADRHYADVMRELAGAVAGADLSLGVVRGTADGTDLVVVGAAIDRRSQVPVPEVAALFDPRHRMDVLPLAGFALPWADQSAEVCRVLEPALRLSAQYRDPIVREAGRVGRRLITPADEVPA